jgi:phosphate transport system substrate-binding protein
MDVRRLVAVLGVSAVALLGVPAPSQAAPAHAQITGSGSSWASSLVNQSIVDLVPRGIPVVYTPTGSATGRSDFRDTVTDFAVTELPFQGVGVTNDTACTDPTNPVTCRAFAYAPLVAGGIAIPYHLDVAGHRVGNLRLSGATLGRIFTGAITRWDDHAIAVENPSLALPDLAITPVVHGEGSAESYAFSQYLAVTQAATWTAFSGSAGPVLHWPVLPGALAAFGSDAVAMAVARSSENGTIGYVENSYAAALGLSTVAVGNADGYFVPPTPGAISIALTQTRYAADGTPDYRNDYTYLDPRTYPIVNHAMMIIPTSSTDPRMTTAKRQSIADFLYYTVCGGQGGVSALGYAPLPRDSVNAALAQLQALKAADAGVDVSALTVDACSNPTLAPGGMDFPTPAPCARVGSPAPCGSPASAPRSVVVRPGAARVAVSWAAPASDGGKPVTGYVVTASPGGRECVTGPRPSCTVTGLRNGTAYRFSVVAQNDYGFGKASAPTPAVRPRTVATAPVRLRVPTSGRGRALVVWAAPSSNGGAAIVRYLVRWSGNGGRTWSAWASAGPARTASRRGLVAKHSCRVQVRAVNAAGAGAIATRAFVQRR